LKKEEETPLSITDIAPSQAILIIPPVLNEDTSIPASYIMPSLISPSGSTLLGGEDIIKLQTVMPNRYRKKDWKLLYSTNEHGVSINTFYRSVEDISPTLIVIKDYNGYIFGGFATQPWKIYTRYYGTGESFLFTLQPQFSFFKWKQENNFFMFSKEDCIAFGGGKHFALWLDSEFENGSSADCETFGNTCLASKEDFRCLTFECWGIA